MASKPSIVTRDLNQLTEPTDNLYESLVIIGKRARNLSTTMKEELSGKLAEFASSVDNLEEVFENREQIEISKFYERQPKPSTIATEEFLDSKLQWRERYKEH
ncbi:MAG: DNA-directed RNA polymerase subunit omega [Cytophagales bacterium]|nr:DNA-directed RNA polymerase subunit omega [Cytophagales bacterium]